MANGSASSVSISVTLSARGRSGSGGRGLGRATGRVCSGQQESGSVCIANRGNDGEITLREWHSVGAIEYGYVVPDPLDPDIVYGAGRNVVTKTHLSTGQVQDITPIPLKGAGDGPIEIVEYEPSWPAFYTAERERLAALMPVCALSSTCFTWPPGTGLASATQDRIPAPSVTAVRALPITANGVIEVIQ